MKRLLIDAKGMRCPLPLLKLKQGLAQTNIGDEVEVRATDAGSWRDIPSFVSMTAHTMIDQSQQADEYLYIVKKGE